MRKGFTLIELLAVIVILAIIALIATPIVLNIIKDSRESAGLRSAQMYLDAVEQSIALEKMNNTNFNPNTCTITTEGNLLCDEKDLIDIEVNGEKPVNGSITFESGKIKKATLEYKNDKVIVMNTKGKLQYQNYISISNYQHKHTDGTIGNHEVTFDSNGHGTCSICMEEVLAAGLYDENDDLVANWDTLVNDYGLDIEKDGIGLANQSAQPDTAATKVLLKSGLEKGSKLVISNSIIRIGTGQFTYSSIKEIEIPNSVTSIGGSAFKNCTGLTLIEIPDSVTNIDTGTFVGCTSLKSIEIPNSVTSIGDYAFSDCTGLSSIEIPNSVTSIGDWTFNMCTSLTTIEIPDSVTSIGDYAFQGCTGLTSIEIPDSVTSIGDYAFKGCTGLTTIDLGDGVTSIGNYAFSDCTSLTSIEIPDSVTNIGNYAFGGIDYVFYNGSATGSPWGAGMINPYIEDGCVYTDNTKSILCSVLDKSLTEITIPDSVTSINQYAFQGCTNLTSVYISSSVSIISAPWYTPAPFYGCSSTLKIYTGVKEDEIPSGWGRYWNYHSNTSTLDVTYGVTREEYESLIG